jgi:hypothetical protein
MKKYVLMICFTIQPLVAHYGLGDLIDPNDPLVKAAICYKKCGCQKGPQQVYRGAAWVGHGIVQTMFYVPGVSYVSHAVAKWAVDQMPLP